MSRTISISQLLFNFVLEAHGVAVVRAFNGYDGIRQSRIQKVDAILLDFDMPYAKGDEVLEALREHELTKYLPVIAITGGQDKRLKIRMKQLGASAHLTKPLKFEDLRKQLARFIDILPALVWVRVARFSEP